ncbi:hypothetical protein [Sphingomonas sp. PB4P5]|uniref:hypothetical protein n=1 Tax=Parasphingomonas puruogangriensis TaxID=3096155 RepID=UPI002FC5F249
MIQSRTLEQRYQLPNFGHSFLFFVDGVRRPRVIGSFSAGREGKRRDDLDPSMNVLSRRSRFPEPVIGSASEFGFDITAG